MNTLKFDVKCKCGPEFVCVRILENCDDMKVGNIWLPSTSHANERLAHCIIEDVGWKASEEYGINVGDYVLIDRLATFAHTAPVAVLKYDSVIVKANAENTEFWPLRNMLFVEPEDKGGVQKSGNIYLNKDEDKMNLGTILKMNIDADKKVPFQTGDRVMLSKGADVVQLGNTILHIYKHDMIVCSIPKEAENA